MKKIFTIIILSVIALNHAKAQKLISFGPKVGANFNFAAGSEMLEPGNVGYSFGAFLEVRPIKFLGISADIMYSKEGFKVGGVEYQGTKSTVNYNLGYLHIPILVNFYVWKGLNVKAGIQPSIKLHGKVGFSNSQNIAPTDQFKDNIKNGNFAIPIGIGYSFKWGLMVDLRYNISTSKAVEIESNNMNISSRVLTATAGWRF